MEAEGNIDPYSAGAIKLLILTGARQGEMLSLQWDWINLEKGIAFLPDSKTGKKSLRLPPPALEALERLPKIDGNPHVIVGKKTGSPLVGLPKIWERVRSRADLHGVRIHDLRRSFASIAAGSGASMLIIGKLLGHASQATTQRYSHLVDDPLTAANDQTAADLAAALFGYKSVE